jgi:2-oxoglutarate ferredoxin oxidoreductase subunit gamma
MVALGAMAKITGALKMTETEEIVTKFFSSDKQSFVPQNVKAIKAGFSAL